MNYSKYEIESSDEISSLLLKKWNKLKINYNQPPFCVILSTVETWYTFQLSLANQPPTLAFRLANGKTFD